MTQVTQTAAHGSTRPLQPLLHDLVACVAAPSLLLAEPDGAIRPGGVSGWYVNDVRLVDRIELALEGSALELVRVEEVDHAQQAFTYVARSLGDDMADPTVVLTRRRTLGEHALEESLEVTSSATEPVDVVLRMVVGGDLATMAQVKQGLAVDEPVAPTVHEGSLVWEGQHAHVRLEHDGTVEDGALVFRGRATRGAPVTARVVLRADVQGPFAGGRPAAWQDRVLVDGADGGLRRTARRSLDDLTGLLLADPSAGGADRFLAAGSPWFLTLFGRDSLWAARLLTPYDHDLPLSTLRVLARRQGEGADPATEEQPGKILHEVRREVLDLGEQVLPPVYYGSVDATPLWVSTLVDAWEWGADEDEVRSLLPAAELCLAWLRAQSEETGWLSYIDTTGRGLSNQGWKDSHDSVQFADGRLAEPPIALSEVQAYAWEAAVRCSELMRRLGVEPPEWLERWATGLRQRFLEQFWVSTPDGGHVAIALDRDGQQVDSVTSNMGHVLATGILDDARAARVAALLARPELDSGFGLRTLTSASPRFSTLSYHGGTVWPHDTAVAVRGLVRTGHAEAAGRLCAGVLAAADAFGGRLPELYGGDSALEATAPTPYPAACRPQAWSAAAPVSMLLDLAGLRADRATGTLVHLGRSATPLGGYRIQGLLWGGHSFALEVAPDGRVEVTVGDGFPLEVTALD